MSAAAHGGGGGSLGAVPFAVMMVDVVGVGVMLGSGTHPAAARAAAAAAKLYSAAVQAV